MKLNFQEKYLIILTVVCFIVVGLYYSYAIFVTKQLQENVVVIKNITPNISLQVNGKDNSILVKGKIKQDINISFTNVENNRYYYQILVKGIQTGIKISSNDIVKGLVESGESKNIHVHINNELTSDVKLEFIIQLNNQDDFDKENGYSYINKEENYDHTNANKPEIAGLNLLPITYQKTSDKDGIWIKADVNNQESPWYDYDNGLWANTALLNDTNYQKYSKLSVGSEIDISDILGFYVWIPRFKYTIINNSNYNNYERITNIIFEDGINTTGTVTCSDKISNQKDKHLYSEICQDQKYHHIYDGLSTYTHPAFKNRKGFWVAKFLMGEGEKVLPNVHILKKNINDANDISKKNVKSHLLTNMEYASLVLLSNSSYGKTGNDMYSKDDTVTFIRIYPNNYEHELTGCSAEYTMYSKGFVTATTNKCLAYNDLTNYSHYSNGVHYSIGEVGPGASSTGTVYGVYDLANKNGELVASFTADSNGQVDTSIVSYDVYSYNDYLGKIASSSNIHNLYRYKLGDAIREHFRTFSENGMWHFGTITHNKDIGVLLRGGNGNNDNASVYTVSICDMNYEAPFRIVLNS